MSDPIGAISLRTGGIQGIGGDSAKRYTVDVGKGDGSSFGDTLKKAIGQVSDAQENAADYVGKFMRGEQVELHQVMAATEEAGIALEMLVELRNKLTDAYRTIINMQS
jgi:flagellar hook-basal body complex protein FliE